jgi:hypothetical protein
MGLLDGNDRGKKIALEGRDGKSTMKPSIPKLWASEKGKQLLEEFNEGSGWVFDKVNYRLVQSALGVVVGGINLGLFDTEREAALAYDRATILMYGEENAETNFAPEESENVAFSNEIMRQINAAKAGQKLH